jgi:hypothetical protein
MKRCFVLAPKMKIAAGYSDRETQSLVVYVDCLHLKIPFESISYQLANGGVYFTKIRYESLKLWNLVRQFETLALRRYFPMHLLGERFVFWG